MSTIATGDAAHHRAESPSDHTSSPVISDPIHAHIMTDAELPSSCTTSPQSRKRDGASTKVEPFGQDGFKIILQTADLRVEMLTYGATINSVKVRDPRAQTAESEGADDNEKAAWMETCLGGFATAAECERAGAPRGSTHGRFAGRIANGELRIDDKVYTLPQNDHGNTLHGGPRGFDKMQWKYLLLDGPEEVGVSFHLTSPHLDQGFPGDLYVTATYAIARHAAQPTLKYNFRANLADTSRCDATVVNLTNHTYWNLNGVPSSESTPFASVVSRAARRPEPITNHILRLNSRYFAATRADLIPSGEMVPTDGTVHDYTSPRGVEEGMRATASALNREPWGYDDTAALDTWDSTLREAAVLYSPTTRLQMRVCTTNPAVVVYTANFLPKEPAAQERFQQHSGICLECQYFPDSPHIDSFPSTVLRKGQTYSETTTHEFMFRAAN